MLLLDILDRQNGLILVRTQAYSEYQDESEDPKLSTYSDKGHQGFLLLINIFHISTTMNFFHVWAEWSVCEWY